MRDFFIRKFRWKFSSEIEIRHLYEMLPPAKIASLGLKAGANGEQELFAISRDERGLFSRFGLFRNDRTVANKKTRTT